MERIEQILVNHGLKPSLDQFIEDLRGHNFICWSQAMEIAADVLDAMQSRTEG